MILNTSTTLKSFACLATLPILAGSLLFAQSQNKDDEEVFELSPFEVSAMGATPGGAQDLNYARSQVAIGNIPHPSTFQAEGLLSEHDLPLKEHAAANGELLSIYGEAMPTRILELPEAAYLAQIGFASGLDAKTWRRAPLNLVAVVDKSGSMSGQPLELVRQSLLAALDQLGPHDQISVVLYGDRSHVYLEPTHVTKANRSVIESSIRGIASAGSTNMEEGLAVGYELARRSAQGFEGSTRLMLFTDERPNTGDTSKDGFMGQMRRGSLDGFGLTTIGVGVQFDAELANKLSSVRGGNLFYFPDRASMVTKFENEFDTFVTELARDLRMTIKPQSGYRIAGVYGVPGDMLQWNADGRSISLEVETIFLSLRKGAIYFALAPTSSTDLPNRKHPFGSEIAKVSLAYEDAASGKSVENAFAFKLQSPESASLGLKRGELLINEYVSIKKAAAAHHLDNDQEAAYRIVTDLGNLLRNADDSSLDSEVEFVESLESQLALLSGHRSEVSGQATPKPVRGIWIAHPVDNDDLYDPLVVQFIGDRVVTIGELDDDGVIHLFSYVVTREPLSSKKRGYAALLDRDELDSDAATQSGLDLSAVGDADYDDELVSIEYRAHGRKMTVKLIGESETLNYVMYRYDGDKRARPRDPIQSAELDPLTGLPKRG